MNRFLFSIVNGERNDWIAVIVRMPLLFFSLFYGLVVKIILLGYQSGVFKRNVLPVPVVSVGNLTVGGSGKTPVCIFLAKQLLAQNVKPVILTRGYRSGGKKNIGDPSMRTTAMAVGFSQDSASLTGMPVGLHESDEVKLLKESLKDVPVVVNPNRYQGGLEAIEQYHPDVILLDDGFQHWKLKRDLDVLLIDCANPFGNEHVLPAGILREYISGIKRSGLIILTKTDFGNVSQLRADIERWYPGIPIAEAVHQPISLTELYTQQEHPLNKIICPVVAFCGIGEPLSFKASLTTVGADVKEFIPFMDHHEYDFNDMMTIKSVCDQLGVRTLVTTRKDAVKLNSYQDFWRGYTLYALNVQIEVTKGLNEIKSKLDHLLRR